MQKTIKIIACFLFLFLCVYLSSSTPRTDFWSTTILFSSLFLLIYYLKEIRFVWLLLLGFGTRFILCFVLPELSDDYYRFVWDGILNLKGVNPYYFKPSELINSLPAQQFIYDNLNSQQYYSVYPSINQYLYTVGIFIGKGDLYWSTVMMKFFILLAEGVSIFSLLRLCRYFKISRKVSLLYILNPLVILEFCGNLHFEGFMIAAILFTLHLLTRKKVTLAAFSFFIAVCVKIMPLILLPLFFRFLGITKGIKFTVITLFLSFLSFIPFEIWKYNVYSHILESINLYFSSFEFNSSIYRLIHYLQIDEHSYFNFLPKVIIIGTVSYFFVKNKKLNLGELIFGLAIVQLVYLILSQSIHPWYILPIIPLSLLVKRLDTFLWSYLVIFTYVTYQTSHYTQSLPVIVTEYILLFGFIIIDCKLMISKKVIDRFF